MPERKAFKPELTIEEHRISLLRAFLDDQTLTFGDVHIPVIDPNNPIYSYVVLYRTKKQGEVEIVEMFTSSGADLEILFNQDFNHLGQIPEHAPLHIRYSNYLKASNLIRGTRQEILRKGFVDNP